MVSCDHHPKGGWGIAHSPQGCHSVSQGQRRGRAIQNRPGSGLRDQARCSTLIPFVSSSSKEPMSKASAAFTSPRGGISGGGYCKGQGLDISRGEAMGFLILPLDRLLPSVRRPSASPVSGKTGFLLLPEPCGKTYLSHGLCTTQVGLGPDCGAISSGLTPDSTTFWLYDLK